MCLIDGKGERGVQNTEQNAVLLRLAREYGDSVVRMCCVYLKDYHLAQDVAQETFLQAARQIRCAGADRFGKGVAYAHRCEPL